MDQSTQLTKKFRLLLALWILCAVAKVEARSHGHPILCDQYDPEQRPDNCPRHIGRNIGIILGVTGATTLLFMWLCCRSRSRRARQVQSIQDHESGALGRESWAARGLERDQYRRDNGSSASVLDENPHWRPQLPSYPPPAYSLRSLEVLPPVDAKV